MRHTYADNYVVIHTGLCRGLGHDISWSSTESSTRGFRPDRTTSSQRFRQAESVLLRNGKWCSTKARQWILWHSPTDRESIAAPENPNSASVYSNQHIHIGRLHEVVQVVGSHAEMSGRADCLLIQNAEILDVHPLYQMPRVRLQNTFALITPSVKSHEPLPR